MFERAGKKNSNNSKYQFWQQHNHSIVLNNPVEAGFVEYPEQFLYSSVRDYSEEKGLINIMLAS
ncbi:MAG: hypothetical protein GQ564_17775 [Bacteroidales bacterium]|nr:hypothetical protein [Bacteroidales bacterium]